MQAIAETPVDSFLEVERRSQPNPVTELPRGQDQERYIDQHGLPATIDVEFWEEPDRSWSAHSEMLRVSVSADSEPEVIARAAGAIDEFWQVLNSRYTTLDVDLRDLLGMRHRPMRFSRKN